VGGRPGGRHCQTGGGLPAEYSLPGLGSQVQTGGGHERGNGKAVARRRGGKRMLGGCIVGWWVGCRGTDSGRRSRRFWRVGGEGRVGCCCCCLPKTEGKTTGSGPERDDGFHRGAVRGKSFWWRRDSHWTNARRNSEQDNRVLLVVVLFMRRLWPPKRVI